MPAAKNSGPQRESLRITQQDKFYSRLLSKETSLANPSFRVYYGGASGAVPFMWESQPGTPKSSDAASTLPPLTPPPSYHSSPQKKSSRKPSAGGLMHCLLPRPSARNSGLLPPSPSVSSSGSSSASNRRSRFSTPQSSFDDNDSADEWSPTSTLSRSGGLRGCCPMAIVKNALLSVVCSHGSTQGTAAQ